MKRDHLSDDEMFMAQLTNRLNVEPSPQWAQPRRSWPWLEIGWALAAALLLGLYWAELRFGFLTLRWEMGHYLTHISWRWIFIGAGAGYGIFNWWAPKFLARL